MKHIILPAIFSITSLIFCDNAKAQLYIDNATFVIQPGAVVTVQGDVTSNADIQGTGKLLLKGSAGQNINMTGFAIPNLEIDNISNATLTGNAKVSGDVLFTNGNIILANNNLLIGSAGTVTNASNLKYFVTNGTGHLVKAALSSTAFIFPVGNSTTAYNPLSISNSGTTDSIGARAFATVLTNGATGSPFAKEVVNNSWDISEATAGGSNLSVTANWNGTDELSGFDRTRTGISYYITSPAPNIGWDLLNTQTGAASGSNPYSVSRTGITVTGVFAVGTRPVLSPLLVSPKIFLQGTYNTSTGMMGDNLRSSNLIPSTEPYSALSFITPSLRGSGGGETAGAVVIGSAAGVSTNNTITDWVLVQLHRSSDGVVISQRAALLQRDGDVVDTDGTSPVSMGGNVAGSYYVSVQHRNHLGVRALATAALAKTTTTNYNFTSAVAQSYAGAVSNSPVATLMAGTVFGMWAGDGTGNRITKYNGPGNDENQLLNVALSGNKGAIVSGYFLADYNLDGSVKYNGPSNDENVLLNIVLTGLKASIITQPNF